MKKTHFYSISIGTILEAYENFLFLNFLPILILLFFPTEKEMTSRILALGGFVCSYFTRPLGSIIFGHFGDRIGRQKTLSFSIIISAFATALMAFLPTFYDIGVVAPILMISCRLIQGFCYGGETTSATVSFVEEIHPSHSGIAASLTTISILIGAMMANIASLWVFNSDNLEIYWRLPFIGSSVAGLVGFYIRYKTSENQHFQTLKKEKKLEIFPLYTVIEQYKSVLIYPILLSSGVIVPFSLIYVYFPEIMRSHFDVGNSFIATLNTILMMASIMLLPAMSYLSDRVGHKKVMIVSLFSLILISCLIFIFWGNSLSVSKIIFIQACLTIFWTSYTGPVNALTVNLFPMQLRCSSLALSASVGVFIFSLTPVFLFSLKYWISTEIKTGLWIIFSAGLNLFVLAKIPNIKQESHN
ncbi:MAG: MFS transporter [Candidatus Rhabdochlamydia sp.]